MENKNKIVNAAPGKAVDVKGVVSSEKDNYKVVHGGVDSLLLFTVLILLAFGLIMVFSASYADAQNRYNDSYYFIKHQLIMAVLGLVFMVAASRVGIRMYKFVSIPLYAISIVLLMLVLVIGSAGGGAQRWINIFGIRFQPSEFAKTTLILMLAWYYEKNHSKVFDVKDPKRATWYGTFVPLGFIGLICALVALEKHLSGLIIIGCIGFCMMIASGIKIKLLMLMAGCGMTLVAAGAMLVDYTRRRILIWINPEAYPQDGGWQTIQGMRAIGSGGFFGLGLGNSRLKYSYVSQPQNDFIYTIVCEELGFIGAVSVILLFGILVWRGFVIAMRCPDRFAQLVAMGISTKTALQVILNIAVVTNVAPNTGISLPFFSYGGTALVMQLVEMGVLLAISRYSLEKK